MDAASGLATGVANGAATITASVDGKSGQAAVAVLRSVFPGVRALRDVTGEMLEEIRARLEPLGNRRPRHVGEEELRPHARAAARHASGG